MSYYPCIGDVVAHLDFRTQLLVVDFLPGGALILVSHPSGAECWFPVEELDPIIPSPLREREEPREWR